ncbi:hypothetical protein [Candidatus Palauibacter sp.]|uniref:hypothetical protein n=1 Tax=Candidatus Palauibacter sp. TaxID=3101350 RepID=UPI003B012FC2
MLHLSRRNILLGTVLAITLAAPSHIVAANQDVVSRAVHLTATQVSGLSIAEGFKNYESIDMEMSLPLGAFGCDTSASSVNECPGWAVDMAWDVAMDNCDYSVAMNWITCTEHLGVWYINFDFLCYV